MKDIVEYGDRTTGWLAERHTKAEERMDRTIRPSLQLLTLAQMHEQEIIKKRTNN